MTNTSEQEDRATAAFSSPEGIQWRTVGLAVVGIYNNQDYINPDINSISL
jgi:hypothetical protein